MKPLEKAIKIISHGNQRQFALKVNEEVKKINSCFLGNESFSQIPELSQQLVSFWLNKNNGICSPYYVQIISNLSGGKVTPHELRPDIFIPDSSEAAA